MPLAPGARVGPYEIVAQIGVGGMGEVYRAKDTGLDRDVAIKVLPDEFAHDVERLARFEREAKTLASLNHPGIAILHGLERTDSTRALVMEFIDGPTLGDRIAEGPLPIDEALAIAAAHVAISNSGTLAYVTGDSGAMSSRTLVWADRSGKEESLGFPDQPYVYSRLSPDGRYIAITTRAQTNGDIWVLDVLRKTARPLTTDASEERHATWTPDGKRLAFGSDRGGEAATRWQPADGSGAPQRLAGYPISRGVVGVTRHLSGRRSVYVR